ncbi:MAG: biotin transporter BioY [Dethiobacter sp.]|jgi:biotin transport system substrate-specific component|nr:MAG: biotin transporter BioY [Dethiobacter sp.]
MRKKKILIRDLTMIAMMAALTSALSYVFIPLPFSPVPVTGQTLGVMLSGALLGSKKGALSQFIYLLMGAIGLPVFAGGFSGIGVLFGPTGGYLWGFIAGAFVIGWLIERQREPRWLYNIAAVTFGGIFVVYFFGVTQLALVTGMGPVQAILLGAVPYLVGDAFKVAGTVVVAQRLLTLNLFPVFRERKSVG